MRSRLAATALLLATMAASGALADTRLELPAQVRQGELVIGRVPPGTQVDLGDRRLRVAPEGWFAFGVGRDGGPVQTVTVRFPDGSRHQAQVPVARRDWRIERVDGLPPSTVSPDPVLAQRIAREQAQVAAARERDDPRTDFVAGFQWPVRGRISGVFGSQRILNGQPRQPHYGFDIAAPTGTPVSAALDGRVTLSGDFFFFGQLLVVDHGHGVNTLYAHLSERSVAEGEAVARGQPIGRIGATGRVTGPHLHFSLSWYQTWLDPQPLLDS
jgi:murein DD-endopeptidase MepM/ murein hydrolase activator NlpD